MTNSNFPDQLKSGASFKANTRENNSFSDIVVVGASHSGISFADKIRKLGFEGSLTLIDQQRGAPIQRPPLSKSFLLEESDRIDSKYLLKRSKWFRENQIVLYNNAAVTSIDTNKKSLKLDDGNNLFYNKLILATGAVPRELPAYQGIANVFVLRQPESAIAIRNRMRDSKAAIIVGGGYIGLEVAATFRQKGLEVRVIELADRLLARVASFPVSEWVAEIHRRHGVLLNIGVGIEEVFQEEGSFCGVKLNDGSELLGDLLVLGIGVNPDSRLAVQATIETEYLDNGAILVDECQRTSNIDIFAVGDVARQRNSLLRIESVHNAQESAGRAAAAVMCVPLPQMQAPWFWSDQYDLNLQSVGIVPVGDSEIYQIARDGKSETEGSFWSYRNKELIAVETLNDPESFMLGKKCLEEKVSPDPDLIRSPDFDLMAWFLKNSA